MFILIFVLFQSVIIGASGLGCFEKLDKDFFPLSFLERYVIDAWTGVHEFLPDTKDLFGKLLLPKRLKNSIQFQNGAIVDLNKKKILILDIVNLSLISKRMNSIIKDNESFLDKYWLEKRCLCSNRREEWVFHTHFKPFFQDITIRPVSLSHGVQAFCDNFFEKKNNDDYCLKIGFRSDDNYTESLFAVAPFLFILVASEWVIDSYLNLFDTLDLDDRYKTLSQFFFTVRSSQNSVNHNTIKDVIFLISTGLSFFIPDSDIELKEIKERFLKLRSLFFKLTSESELNTKNFDSKKKSLNTVNHPNDIASFNFNQKIDFLFGGAKSFLNFENFEKTLSIYEKKFFNDFSNEKKLLFIYCKNFIFNDRFEVVEIIIDPFLKNIKNWIRAFFNASLQRLFQQCYQKDAVGFFSVVRCFTTEKLKDSRMNSFLAPLLSIYDVPNFFSFFKDLTELNRRIEVLQDNYHTLSCDDITIHFSLLLGNDWQTQFEKIADSNFEKLENIRKIYKQKIKDLKNESAEKIETALNQSEIDHKQAIQDIHEKRLQEYHANTEQIESLRNQMKLLNDNLISKEQLLQQQLSQNLELVQKMNTEPENYYAVAEEKAKQRYEQEREKINTEGLKFRNKLLKIFIVVQVSLIFIYSVFFKYMSKRSCVT